MSSFSPPSVPKSETGTMTLCPDTAGAVLPPARGPRCTPALPAPTAQHKQSMEVTQEDPQRAVVRRAVIAFGRSARRQREGAGILFPISICSCCCSECKITLRNLWHPAWLLWQSLCRHQRPVPLLWEGAATKIMCSLKCCSPATNHPTSPDKGRRITRENANQSRSASKPNVV